MNFKPWELTILGTIPLVAIHGLDGGADTGTDLDRGNRTDSSTCMTISEGIQNPGAMGDTCSWTLSSDQVTANKNKNRSSLGLKQKAGDYGKTFNLLLTSPEILCLPTAIFYLPYGTLMYPE